MVKYFQYFYPKKVISGADRSTLISSQKKCCISPFWFLYLSSSVPFRNICETDRLSAACNGKNPSRGFIFSLPLSPLFLLARLVGANEMEVLRPEKIHRLMRAISIGRGGPLIKSNFDGRRSDIENSIHVAGSFIKIKFLDHLQRCGRGPLMKFRLPGPLAWYSGVWRVARSENVSRISTVMAEV